VYNLKQNLETLILIEKNLYVQILPFFMYYINALFLKHCKQSYCEAFYLTVVIQVVEKLCRNKKHSDEVS